MRMREFLKDMKNLLLGCDKCDDCDEIMSDCNCQNGDQCDCDPKCDCGDDKCD